MMPEVQNQHELRSVMRVARMLDRIPKDRDRGRVAYAVWRWVERREEPASPVAAKVVKYVDQNITSRRNRDFVLWGLKHSYIKPFYRPTNRTIAPHLRTAVFERDGRRCRNCGSETRLSIDHIHPVALGGQDELGNFQVLCVSCNSRKGARLVAANVTAAESRQG